VVIQNPEPELINDHDSRIPTMEAPSPRLSADKLIPIACRGVIQRQKVVLIESAPDMQRRVLVQVVAEQLFIRLVVHGNSNAGQID